MKRWLLFLSLVISIGFCSAQKKSLAFKSSIIGTKKVIMRHNSYNEDSTLTTWKDSLLIPVASDKYPQLKKGLSEAIFDGDSLASIVKRFEAEGTGITETSYEIPFENKDVISIKIYYECMGAHPDNYWVWHTLNVHTGKPYPISKEITIAGLKWIYHTYKADLKKDVEADRRGRKNDEDYKKNKEEYDETYKYLNEGIDLLSFKDMFTSYIFNKKGIVFTTDNFLPHGMQPMEPGHDWFIPYTKLRRYKAATAIMVK